MQRSAEEQALILTSVQLLCARSDIVYTVCSTRSTSWEEKLAEILLHMGKSHREAHIQPGCIQLYAAAVTSNALGT
jgi:hypothetical protein